MAVEVKTIGSSGQISIGKQHAGRTVIVDEIEDGVWIIKTAQVIPDNERWLHEPKTAKLLDQALEWSAKNPSQESDLGKLEAKLKRAKKL
jgi:hypothetical protein